MIDDTPASFPIILKIPSSFPIMVSMAASISSTLPDTNTAIIKQFASWKSFVISNLITREIDPLLSRFEAEHRQCTKRLLLLVFVICVQVQLQNFRFRCWSEEWLVNCLFLFRFNVVQLCLKQCSPVQESSEQFVQYVKLNLGWNLSKIKHSRLTRQITGL